MSQGTGTLHLLPVGLGDAPIDRWLPREAQAIAGGLGLYIAENAKTARAFLKLTGWLAPLREGQDIGLVSEAGCPAVADPGARAVAIAHAWGVPVRPWVGPSSILLGLMASGLDGQRFAFHGYAPVDPAERARQLKAWEQVSSRQRQTQLFIETPYRNTAMLASLLEHLKANTRLCVARSLTTTDEWIRTMTVAQWKSQPRPALDKHPTLFLFLAS